MSENNGNGQPAAPQEMRYAVHTGPEYQFVNVAEANLRFLTAQLGLSLLTACAALGQVIRRFEQEVNRGMREIENQDRQKAPVSTDTDVSAAAREAAAKQNTDKALRRHLDRPGPHMV